MPMLKSVSGHNSVRALKKYLERDGRARQTVMLNLGDERTWAADMDATRKSFGHDKKRGGRGRCRFYEHFIISPDPEDAAALDRERVCALALQWASEQFPDHECAIILHDDTARAGFHAHVVVNCSNLATGLKLQISDNRSDELAHDLQRIAERLGFSTLPDLPLQEKREEVSRTFAERGMAERGRTPWKEEIRRAVAAAGVDAPDFATLSRNLKRMGFSMRLTEKGITYTHADGIHEATDRTLGAAFSKKGIAETTKRTRRPKKLAERIEEAGPRSHFSAGDLARCLRTIRAERIEALSDFAPRRTDAETALAEAKRAMRQGDATEAQEQLATSTDRLNNLVYSEYVAKTVLEERTQQQQTESARRLSAQKRTDQQR